MNRSRERILGRLYNAQQHGADAYHPPKKKWQLTSWDQEERIEKFTQYMQAVRSEVFRVKKDQLIAEVHKELNKREIPNLLYAPATLLGENLKKEWPEKSNCQPIAWQGEAEECKKELFGYEASITSSQGAIAESAAIILWPTPEEPRLMSIVPPLHIVVVEAEKIYTSFQEAIEELQWSQNMPTNALLISGPSKTADIELILQYGVHGPIHLLVYIVE